MAIKTYSQLKTLANQIQNETLDETNTAIRVGGFMNDFLDSVDSLTGHLWQFELDGQYQNLASALVIAAGVRTKLTINGQRSSGKSPNLITPVWDVAISKFNPLKLGDFYFMRLAITGQSDNNPSNRYEVEFDVGGTAGVIARETGVFVKGSGNSQGFNFSSGFFVGADFLANGGEIYITPLDDARFWELGVTISRTYKVPE